MQLIREVTNTKLEQPSDTKQATLVMFMNEKKGTEQSSNYPTITQVNATTAKFCEYSLENGKVQMKDLEMVLTEQLYSEQDITIN